MRLNMPSTPNVTTPGAGPSRTLTTRLRRGKNVTICALLPRANEYAACSPASYEPIAGAELDNTTSDVAAALDARTSSACAARATPSVTATTHSNVVVARRKGNFPTRGRVMIIERIKP